MKFIRTLVLALFLLSFGSAPVGAQGETEGYSADQLEEDGFVAADGNATDGVPGGPLMLAAYMALWILVGGYVVRLARRHNAVQEEYAGLRKSLEDIDDRLDEHSARG